MNHFHLLHLSNTPILRQLQIEEALLRTDTRNWCIINKGSTPAIVMGISGKPDELIHTEALKTNTVPVIRRFSGGGTVVVDKDTFFITWIGNADETGVPCCPKKLLEWTANLYQPAFHPVDFKLKENDYAIGMHKCGGNAQYLRKNRWLHHTSFLWDYREERMSLLKIPPKIPEYRQQRNHEDFLCRLKNHFTDDILFEQQLLCHFKTVLEFTRVDFSEAEIENILRVPHRSATTTLTFD